MITAIQMIHAHNELEKFKVAMLKGIIPQLQKYKKKVIKQDGSLTEAVKRDIVFPEHEFISLPGQYTNAHLCLMKTDISQNYLYLTLTVRSQAGIETCFYRNTKVNIANLQDGYIESVNTQSIYLVPKITSVEAQFRYLQIRNYLKEELRKNESKRIEDFDFFFQEIVDSSMI